MNIRGTNARILVFTVLLFAILLGIAAVLFNELHLYQHSSQKSLSSAVAESQTPVNYFTQHMLSEVSPTHLVVVRQGYACPTSNTVDNSTYPNFPLTVCQSQDMVAQAQSTWTNGSFMHFIWEDRADGYRQVPPNPSAYPPSIKSNGSRCYLHYSTYLKAEGAMDAEIAYSAGAPAHNTAKMGYLDFSEAAGFPDSSVYSHADFNTQVNALCNGTVTDYQHTVYSVASDIVVLPQGRMTDVKTTPNMGFLIDYEAQDGRTNSVSHVADEANIAHYYGYSLSIYTNPLDGATSIDNDFTSQTVPQILANPYIKYFTVLLVPQTTSGSMDASLSKQLSIMNGGALPSTSAPFLTKVMVTYQIGTGSYATTLSEAQTIHSDLLKWNIPAINIFPKGAVFSGPGCDGPNAMQIQNLAAVLGLPSPCSVSSGEGFSTSSQSETSTTSPLYWLAHFLGLNFWL